MIESGMPSELTYLEPKYFRASVTSLTQRVHVRNSPNRINNIRYEIGIFKASKETSSSSRKKIVSLHAIFFFFYLRNSNTRRYEQSPRKKSCRPVNHRKRPPSHILVSVRRDRGFFNPTALSRRPKSESNAKTRRRGGGLIFISQHRSYAPYTGGMHIRLSRSGGLVTMIYSGSCIG